MLFLFITLVGCETTDNEPIEFSEPESIKTITNVWLSGIRYTTVSYSYILDDYTYFCWARYPFEMIDDEFHPMNISVTIDGHIYLYNLVEGEWVTYDDGLINDYPKGPPSLRNLDLDWFEPNDVTEEDTFGYGYELRLKEDSLRDYFMYQSDGDFDEERFEELRNYLMLYINVDEDGNIIKVQTTSFPTYEYEWLPIDIEYPLPDSIKTDLDIE